MGKPQSKAKGEKNYTMCYYTCSFISGRMRLMDLPVAHVLLSFANQKWNVMCLNLYFIVFNLAAIFG